MRSIRSKDTGIELVMRRALWQNGIRYRKNAVWLPGKPDIAITKYRIAVFCDSAFFHGKDFQTKKPVANNHDFWDAKIRRNMERDREVNEQLRAIGWTVVRFWDTDILKHTDECVRIVCDTIQTTAEKGERSV